MPKNSAFKLLSEHVDELSLWLDSFPKGMVRPEGEKDELDRAGQVLRVLVERLKGNYPFQSGIYAGQMIKPPHEVAWAAYVLASLINPNNHALDGGPPTSEMEKEVIPVLAEMFGFLNPVLGHLTSSGTIANLEALWVARQVSPDKAVGFSGQAHYTHSRMCEVLGLKSIEIPVDDFGNWDLEFLGQHAIELGTVVVTLGTTGMGRVESLHKILPICQNHGIRIHLDAAYGGYFSLLARSGEIDSSAWKLVSQADSLVVDPHKHGLQPYGCGCVIFKDPSVGRFYKHDSPYTYFSSDDLHLGEISLECSRPGAAAAALWATIQVFDLNLGGQMEAMMRVCRNAAIQFADEISNNGKFLILENPQLDIVVYAPIVGGDVNGLEGKSDSKPESKSDNLHHNRLKTSEIGKTSQKIFKLGMDAGKDGVFVSLYKIKSTQLKSVYPDLEIDSEMVTVLRSVFMKPIDSDMVSTLVERLNYFANSSK